MRIAWFTPLSPVRSGIARYSEEILPALADQFEIDPVDESRAHDFVWRHFRHPYDLIVYQLGNAACHAYMWPYLVRYPGLDVLHDAQLHQSRAASLLTPLRRADEYRAEFVVNHPDADPGIAELVIQGLGGDLLHFWPFTRLVVERARMVAVHAEPIAERLREITAGTPIEAIPMGVPPHRSNRAAAAAIRARFGIPADAVVFTALGRVTPEKRIAQAIRALSALARDTPDVDVRLMLVGECAPYYDALEDARARGVADRVTVTGYAGDEELSDYIEAADVCVCLRWPTNGETSASWLRCLSAGRSTVITDLAHTALVPSLDPRTWAPVTDAAAKPIAVSVDILDEDHSLALAMRRLSRDPLLRRTLGASAHEYWGAHHTIDHMADAYRRVLPAAAARTAREIEMPKHLKADGTELAEEIAEHFGLGLDFLKR
jgi:glycosyltransferase involved in cell wall biosynthesis